MTVTTELLSVILSPSPQASASSHVSKVVLSEVGVIGITVGLIKGKGSLTAMNLPRKVIMSQYMNSIGKYSFNMASSAGCLCKILW